MMAANSVRLWAFVPVAQVSAAQAALDDLGRPDMGGSFLGNFPGASPVLHYAGWQGSPALIGMIQGALAPVSGVQVFRGAVYGHENENSPGVVQEGSLNGNEPTNPGLRYSRRACIKLTYARLGLGAPPSDLISQR